jgi:hypothetical protein
VSVFSLLDSVCMIKRVLSTTQDSAGGQVQNFQVIAQGMPCSKQESSGVEYDLYGQPNTRVSTTLHFAVDPQVEVKDRIDVTDPFGVTAPYTATGEAQGPNQNPQVWTVNVDRIRQPAALGQYAPVIDAPTVADVTQTTAVLGGTVESAGIYALSGCGVVWARTADNPSPTLQGTGCSYVNAEALALGTFTAEAEGLSPGTAYSFCAFAVNGYGAAYSSVGTFTTEVNVVVQDSFVGANGTLLPAHMPNVGGPWMNDPLTDGTDFTIESDAAINNTSGADVSGDLVDCGSVGITTTASVIGTDPTTDVGLVLCAMAADPSVGNPLGVTELTFEANLEAGWFELDSWVNGSNTQVATSTAVVPAENVSCALKAVCTDAGNGINVDCYANDVLLFSYLYQPIIQGGSSFTYKNATWNGICCGYLASSFGTVTAFEATAP